MDHPKATAAGIHCMPIPTPFAVGRVNTYLVEDDPLTLVDTGPNSGTSLTVLEAALAEHGRKVEDLERIVVTHQHIDHLGLVAILARRSGAEVCALDILAPWMARFGLRMDDDDRFAEETMLRNGIPADITQALRAVSASFRGWGSSAEVTRELHDGGTLDFAGRAWTVHHRPGHSPSDTVFHEEATGILVGGDHLIKHISSNPLLARPLGDDDSGARAQSLVSYMASMGRTREMALDLVLSGHGEPIEDHASLIDERLRLHERRARKIGGLIADRPRTAYEIAQDLWGNIAVTQAFLTLSEVLGHVDLLLNRGEVVEVEEDGVVHFASAA